MRKQGDLTVRLFFFFFPSVNAHKQHVLFLIRVQSQECVAIMTPSVYVGRHKAAAAVKSDKDANDAAVKYSLLN